QHEAGEERRHSIGEDDLGDLTVGFEVAVAAIVVPVADAPAILQVAVGGLVSVAPRVELVAVVRVEELAVLLVAAAGVAVGGNDRVARRCTHTGRIQRIETRFQFPPRRVVCPHRRRHAQDMTPGAASDRYTILSVDGHAGASLLDYRPY